MRSFILLSIVATLALNTFAADKPDCVCCSAEQRAFDFWLGDWDVSTEDGNAAGSNNISKIQDGCALQERWTSANGGFTGTSYNFYNTEKKQWQQLWLDNQGGNLELSGSRIENQMVLQTKKAKDKSGKDFIHRITWTMNKDGSVRQLWETITEGEDTKIVFDGLYEKKK